MKIRRGESPARGRQIEVSLGIIAVPVYQQSRRNRRRRRHGHSPPKENLSKGVWKWAEKLELADSRRSLGPPTWELKIGGICSHKRALYIYIANFFIPKSRSLHPPLCRIKQTRFYCSSIWTAVELHFCTLQSNCVRSSLRGGRSVDRGVYR